MKKKIISSLLATLMIAGSTSFSAFAAMPNGTVVIGNKSFELAYANDPSNLREISNEIIKGGAIYVKDFSGNWIDNTTGKIVDASVVPGEGGTVQKLTYQQALDLVKSKVKLDDYDVLSPSDFQGTNDYNGAKCYTIMLEHNGPNDDSYAVGVYLVNSITGALTYYSQGQYNPVGSDYSID